MAYVKKEPTLNTFYDIEVSQETYNAVYRAARVMSEIIKGDLSAVVDYALTAYRARTGAGVPQDIEHNIRECARGLSTWGWNRPVEYEHETQESRIYNDLARVLDVQTLTLNGLDMSDIELTHENESVPLPRVRCVYQSTQARIKQLRVITDKITNKKPR